MRKRHILLLPFLLLACGLLQPAAAETSTVTIAEQYGLGYLPTIVMRHERLIERQAEAAGVKGFEVRWTGGNRRDQEDPGRCAAAVARSASARGTRAPPRDWSTPRGRR